jgi:hypothetical protein
MTQPLWYVWGMGFQAYVPEKLIYLFFFTIQNPCGIMDGFGLKSITVSWVVVGPPTPVKSANQEGQCDA